MVEPNASDPFGQAGADATEFFLLARLQHWTQRYLSELDAMRSHEAIPWGAILAAQLRHATQAREWIDRIAGMAECDAIPSRYDDHLERLSGDYLRLVERIAADASTADNLPREVLDTLATATASLLIAAESGDIGEPASTARQLWEQSTELDTCHAIAERILRIAEGERMESDDSNASQDGQVWSEWMTKAELEREVDLGSWRTLMRRHTEPSYPVEIEVDPTNKQRARYRERGKK